MALRICNPYKIFFTCLFTKVSICIHHLKEQHDLRNYTCQSLKLSLRVNNNNSDACLDKCETTNSPSSQMMAMQARTMRSLSCSPSFPTAIREFVKELGKSCAFTVIIWTGKITDWDEIQQTQITHRLYWVQECC